MVVIVLNLIGALIVLFIVMHVWHQRALAGKHAHAVRLCVYMCRTGNVIKVPTTDQKLVHTYSSVLD